MNKLKIWFADLWPYFYYDNNYFYHLLNTAYDVEVDESDPELIIYSHDPYQNVDRKRNESKNAKRVFWSMEGVPAKLDSETTYPPASVITTRVGEATTHMDPLSNLTGDANDSNRESYYYQKCDFALGFDINDDSRYKRFPYWTYQINWFDKSSYVDPDLLIPEANISNNEYYNTPKTKFCAAFFSNLISNRMEFYNKLSEYKQVDGYGDHFGNGFFPWSKKKLEISKDYKFVSCFENKLRPGYHTERLYDAKLAGAVPIYWGHSTVANDFNVKSFINLNDYDSIDELVEYIKEVDQNDDLYNSYAQEPLFTNNTIADEFKPDAVLDFFTNTVLS